MTNEEKIREIEQKHRFQSDWFEEALQEIADWKDEQHKQEKQQWIEKTTNCIQDLSLERDYLDIMVIEDELVKLMYGTVDLEKVHYKPLDEDFERDAVNFCFDNGLNTTPYIAKTIAKHFFELGLKSQKGE